MSGARDHLRWSVTVLLGRAQEAGLARRDIDTGDLLRISHGAGMVVESTPEGDDRADRFVRLLMDGLGVKRP